MTKLNISSVVSSLMSHESSGPFWNILAIESDVVMQPYGAVDNKAEQSTTPMRTREPHAYQYCCIPQRFSSSKRNEVAFHEFPSMGEREKKSVNQDSTRRRTIVQFREKSQLQKRQSRFGSGERLARSLHNPTSLSIS